MKLMSDWGAARNYQKNDTISKLHIFSKCLFAHMVSIKKFCQEYSYIYIFVIFITSLYPLHSKIIQYSLETLINTISTFSWKQTRNFIYLWQDVIIFRLLSNDFFIGVIVFRFYFARPVLFKRDISFAVFFTRTRRLRVLDARGVRFVLRSESRSLRRTIVEINFITIRRRTLFVGNMRVRRGRGQRLRRD